MKKMQRTLAVLALLTGLLMLAACSRQVTGTYGSKDEPGLRLELRADGGFSVYNKSDHRLVASGTYKVDGKTITTFAINGGAKLGTGKIDGDNVIDSDGKIWKKE